MFNRLFGKKQEKIWSENPTLPNKYSIEIGNKIAVAREDIGYSQKVFAKLIYLSVDELHAIESGQIYLDVMTLLYISNRTEKPFRHFFPDEFEIWYDLSEADNKEIPT